MFDILGKLPLLMRAVAVATAVAATWKSGGNVIGVVQKHGQDVQDLLIAAGAEFWPDASQEVQVAAAATRFDPDLVVRIQSKLNSAMSAGLAVDGDYGPRTKTAVQEFQRKNGLEPDGWAGPVTQKALFG